MPVGNAVPDFEVSLVRGLQHEYHFKATSGLCALLQLLEPLTGTSVSLQQAKGQKGTLLVFMCNHCPFVIHLRGQVLGLLQKILVRSTVSSIFSRTLGENVLKIFFRMFSDALIQLTRDVQPLGVEVIGISSNSAVTHPQDGPAKMAEDARSFGTTSQRQLSVLVCVSL